MTGARSAAGTDAMLGRHIGPGALTGIAGRGIDHLRARRAWLMLAGLLVLYNSAGHLLLWNIGGGDYWEHLATFHAFARNPLQPDNPYVARAEPTHLFTPYHLFWGVVARLLGLHPMNVLPLAGAANTLVFLAACRILARRVLGDPRWALSLTLTLLTFWWQPWTWSGFYHLGFLPIASIYPFWFALPLAWITIASCLVEPAVANRWRGRALLRSTIVALAVALVFLTHPLSGIFLVVALFALGIGIPGLALAPRLALLLAPPLGIGLALLWPFFPVLETVRTSGQFHARGFAGDFRVFYDRPFLRLLPAWIGLPIVLRALARGRWDPIALGFLLFLALYGLNYVTLASSTLARSIVFVAFFLHLAVVKGLHRDPSLPRARLHEVLFLAFLLLFGALEGYASAKRFGPFHDWKAGTPLGQHSNRRVLTELIALDRFVTPADVVMAPLAESWLLPGALGCKVVGVMHSNPFLADYAERIADTERFFAAETQPAERETLIATYGVRFVLVPAGSAWHPRGDDAERLQRIAEEDGLALYAVTDAAGRRAPPVTPGRARDPAPPLPGSSP